MLTVPPPDRLEPFTECHKITDPSPFLKKCFNTMCDCLASKGNEEECRCQALTRYVSKCLEKNPDVPLSNWRITTKCCECWVSLFTAREAAQGAESKNKKKVH